MFSKHFFHATKNLYFLSNKCKQEKLPGFYEPAENNMHILLDWQMLEGVRLDDYTYEGVLRIDMEEVPEQFELDFSIREVWVDYMNEEKTAHNHMTFVVDGCDFKIPIERSDKDLKMISVNEIGKAGVGMKSVQISPVEVTLNPINTKEEEGLVIYSVILDAKGHKLESGSMDSPDVYAIGDSDISTLYVYVCEWDEYMDIKGLALEEDVSLFQNALEECALYKKVIDTIE